MRQGTEHANHFFLGHQTQNGGNSRLPGAEAQRCEEKCQTCSNQFQNGCTAVLLGDVVEAALKGQAIHHPDDDAGGNDHRTGPLNEAPAAVPGGTENVAGHRCVVSGKLHNEGSGIARKRLGLFQNEAGDDHGGNADEVGGGGNQTASAEQCTGDQANDGHFCTAGDETGGHNGHFPVTVLINGTGCHDTGDTTAGGDQHGNKGLTGQAELTEKPVHDKGNTGHIAAIFQNGQEQEQHQHLRNEAQNCTNATHDAVHDQAVQPGGNDGNTFRIQKHQIQKLGNAEPGTHPGGHIAGFHQLRKGAKQTVVHKHNRPVAHGADRQGVDHPHHHRKDGQSQNPVGNHQVDLVGKRHFTGRFLLVAVL